MADFVFVRGRTRCIDCGFALSSGTTSWPTCKPMQVQIIKSPDTTAPPGARNKQAFELNGGAGTHIDAPSHFVVGGRTVDQLTPAELCGVPLALIDVSLQVAADCDFACTADDVRRNEERFGAIPPSALVCLRTGWAETRFSSEEYYNITDADDLDSAYVLPKMHFPGFALDAVQLLVDERCAVGLGIDTLSPDPGASGGFGVHHAVLGKDRYILENLLLSRSLPARGALAFVSPMNVVGAPESPARVWVTVNPDPTTA